MVILSRLIAIDHGIFYDYGLIGFVSVTQAALRMFGVGDFYLYLFVKAGVLDHCIFSIPDLVGIVFVPKLALRISFGCVVFF